MRILTRYLLRAHLGPFLFSISVLTGLLIINTVARRFADLAGKGLPARVIGEVFLLSVPYTLALTLPMSVLVAVLFAFSQFTTENELTALKASGVDLTRLLLPLMMAAVLIAGGMVWFNDRVLPESNHRLKNLLIEIGRKSPTLQLKEQTVNRLQSEDGRSRYFLQAGRIEPSTNRLWDVVIYDLSESERDRTIYADSGWMAFNQAQTDLFLTLYDGSILERTEREPSRFFRLFFGQQQIRVAGIGNQFERGGAGDHRGDREMTVGMLNDEIRTRRQEIEGLVTRAGEESVAGVRAILEGRPNPVRTSTHAPPAEAWQSPIMLGIRQGFDPLPGQTMDEIRILHAQADVLEQGVNRYLVELHKKFAIPFACIVFVLIGAPLAVRFPRGGVGMVIAISLGIFGIYWMGLTGGEWAGDKGIVPPYVAMWTVNTVFLVLGVLAVTRFGRETTTARGNLRDDMADAIRGLFRRRSANGGLS